MMIFRVATIANPERSAISAAMTSIMWALPKRVSCVHSLKLAGQNSSVGTQVQLMLGSGIAGGGYRGVPLQTYLAVNMLLPFHWLYSRLLLKAAAVQLQHDLNIGASRVLRAARH